MKKLTYKQKRKLNAIIFLLPWLIGFFTFFLVPVINSVIYSFNSVGVGAQGGIEMTPVGFQNYIDLFKVEVSTDNQQFLRVFINENIRIFLYTPIVVIFSLFSAIIVNVKFKGQGIARVIFFLPIILGLDVVLKLITVTTGSDFVDTSVSGFFSDGIIMQFLMQNNFLPISVTLFISNLSENIFSLISQCGVQTLIFLAGLQSISSSLYEVAKIEGATAYETFWKLTLPMLGNIFMFALIYSFVDLFLTSPIAEEIYHFAFTRNSIGIGAALSTVYLINVLVDLLVLVFIFTKVVRVQYDS